MEVWKDIPNYENKYQISNLGTVRSLSYKKSGIPKELKLHINDYERRIGWYIKNPNTNKDKYGGFNQFNI